MTRGALRWRITVPADGRPLAGGAVPALIRWPAGTHPADAMAESGITLISLTVAHPEPARIAAMLAALGWRGEGGLPRVIGGERVALSAAFATPQGPRQLG